MDKKESNVLVISTIDGYVQSRSRRGMVHLVWYNNFKWSCGCEDWVFRGKQEDFECYHIKRFKEEVSKICGINNEKEV